MTRKTAWLGAGAALGAGLMALLDPQQGRRRRAVIRDKASRSARALEDSAGKTWRDLRQRATGLAAETRRSLRGELAPDEVIAERVRSRVGRLVSHPGSIVVTASRGMVRLEGPVLTREVDRLIRGVRDVRGVIDVENRLELHDQADGVPGLQGDGIRREPRFELLQENWSPTARLLAGAAGAGIALLGARRRGIVRTGMIAVGSGLFARAATNFSVQRLLGVGPARRAVDVVDVRKSGTPGGAPVEKIEEMEEAEARGRETTRKETPGESPAAVEEKKPARPPRRRRPAEGRSSGVSVGEEGGNGKTEMSLKEEE